MARLKKATFSLPEEVLSAVSQAVTEGAAPSKNAFVERALLKELDQIRRHHLREELELAAKDPLFLRDLDEIESAFRFADAETARQIG